MYAFEQTAFPNTHELIQLSAVMIVLSLFIHVLSPYQVQKKLD
jgi:hypothetical protein